MMLKLGRNMRWVEILWNLKNFEDVISNSKVWRQNRHFDVMTTNKVEILHCFFVFEWIKLKFGVGENFGLLISQKRSLGSKS